MRHLITTAVLLICTSRCPADDALGIPTHDDWQGQAIGSWKATRITYGSPKKPAEQGKIYKALLLGESQDANSIVVWGETDENCNYISVNPTTVGGAWSVDNPIPVPDVIREEVLEVKGTKYPVVVQVFNPKPDKRSGVLMGSEIWKLKSHPGFVLLRNQSQRDTFKGETFEYLINERLTAVCETNVLGKTVRAFRIQHEETVGGRTTSKAMMLKSHDLPEQGLIYSHQTWYTENGDEKSTTTIELVGCGHAPEEVAGHLANMRARRFPKEYASLDSEAGRTNVAHLMRQGMPREIAEEVVTSRISLEDLDYGQMRAGELAALWDAYRAGRSEDNRQALLTKLQQIGSNSIGYIEPSLEKILLAVTRGDDTDLRIMAFTTLSGYVPVLYAPMLEAALIQNGQWTNAPAIQMLSSTKWGNPRRVLSQDGVDISTLPLRSIPYAPEAMAVPELIKRYEAGNRYQKSEVLEHLAYYSAPEVRDLFTTLSASLTPDDFRWGKTDRSYLVRHLIIAAADLNLENAPKLFLEWMDWNQSLDGTDSQSGRDTMLKTAIDVALITYGPRLRDKRVASAITDRLKPGSMTLFPLMHEEHLDRLLNVELTLTPQKMEDLLSEPLQVTMSEKPLKEEQLFGLLRLFRFSPSDENLDYVMSKLAPEWTPGTDYAGIAQTQAKYWYTQRKGIKAPNAHDIYPEIMADLLPYFGDRGAKILIQLAGYPGFRRHAVPALMKITVRRDDATEALSKIQAGTDDDRFLIGLTLWCLGDDSQHEQYEKYIRFEPLHSSRSHKARRAMCYLPFDTAYPLIQDIRNGHPDNYFPMWAATVLSYHKNRKSAALMMSLWDDEITSRHNSEYGELFNRMAGRNFGMDRAKIRRWIEALPEK